MMTFRDILIVLLVCGIMIAIGVHAPSNASAYAQMRQMGASVGMLETGNWLLPHNHEGRLMRKPQLYGWLVAPVLLITDSYTDFVYRWPSVVGALACGVMVYLLARRWLGSSKWAVLAGCFWACGIQMGKLMYLGTTDMLHVLWLVCAVYFTDRLLFSRSRLNNSNRWSVLGLWASIILGALTKGWGVANIPFVAFYIFLVCLLKGNFKPRLVLDNISNAAKTCKFWWGISAFVLVMVPLFIAMYLVGGQEFLDVVNYEIVQRITGNGDKPSQGSRLWPVVWLFLTTIPWSILVVLGFVVTPFKRWFDLYGPFCRAILWSAAFVIPFSITHGFRSDYLAPCYPADAILAVLGVMQIIKYAKSHLRGAICRHLLAATAITGSCVMIFGAVLFLFYRHLPESLTKLIPQPYLIQTETTVLLWVGLVAGAIMVVWSVWASLSWRLAHLGYVAVIAMLGIHYYDRHLVSRHARSWDGPTLIQFADAAKEVIKDDKFALCRSNNLGTDLYMGRFGQIVRNRKQLIESDAKWLITCDGGLVMLQAAKNDIQGDYIIKANDYTIRDGKYLIRDARYISQEDDIEINRKDLSKTCFKTTPQVLGDVIDLNIDRPVLYDGLGRLYLIKIRR